MENKGGWTKLIRALHGQTKLLREGPKCNSWIHLFSLNTLKHTLSWL